MVYEPREDSWLLAEVVAQHAKGRVIDVGTGSGVLARAALDAGLSDVVAVDIDPAAVAHAQSCGVSAVESDLFSAVSGVFDTIVCNAPYLPSDESVPDVALDGGKRGFEWTLRFLECAIPHLSARGQILLLVSSYTNPSVVEEWLLKNAFSWEVVASEKVWFEELVVYRITRALPDRAGAVFVARGRRSCVYRDSGVAVKVSSVRRVAQEARMLKKVNALGIGPQFLSAQDDTLCMEFIDGERIDRYLASCSLREAERVLSEVLRQCAILDEAGVNKQEMTYPYKHVIISGERVVLIDWERSKPTVRPANVAQCKEYLRRVRKEFPHLSGVLV